jgi:hypothetical protein
LTEDLKNPDVLYLGTETGIMISTDRGQSWRRLKANLPTVRVDEITLHPRDNAMIVATHGRALWILDHLEPIQEYTAVHNAKVAAQLFTQPTALQWKSKDDRNDEFWGHNYFIGENPPTDAVIPFFVKNRLDADAKLRISDAAGRTVRELEIGRPRREPGVHTMCWDMRVEPITSTAGGGGGGRGRGRGAADERAEIPGVPTPIPAAGYKAQSPCAIPAPAQRATRDSARRATRASAQGAATDSARGTATDSARSARAEGQGGGRGGAGGSPGPQVVPGTYTVSLVVKGDVLDTEPLTIIMDPMVDMTASQRARYNVVVADLHELQRRGTVILDALTSLNPQMVEAAKRIGENNGIPASLRSQFDALNTEFAALREQFGVSETAGLPGQESERRGRGRGQTDPANVLGRVSALKNTIMGTWEVPSAALMKQYEEAQAALPKAIAAADAFLGRAAATGDALKKFDIAVSVSAPAPAGDGGR